MFEESGRNKISEHYMKVLEGVKRRQRFFWSETSSSLLICDFPIGKT